MKVLRSDSKHCVLQFNYMEIQVIKSLLHAHLTFVCFNPDFNPDFSRLAKKIYRMLSIRLFDAE